MSHPYNLNARNTYAIILLALAFASALGQLNHVTSGHWFLYLGFACLGLAILLACLEVAKYKREEKNNTSIAQSRPSPVPMAAQVEPQPQPQETSKPAVESHPSPMIHADESWREYTRDVFFSAIWIWHYKPEMGKKPLGLAAFCLECPRPCQLQPTRNFMGRAHYACDVCGTEYHFPLGAIGDTQMIKNEITRKLEDGSFRDVLSRQRANRGF